MTFDLRQIEEDFADAPVEFVGVFPNASTTKDQLASFKSTYGLHMPMMLDTIGWADSLGANWTPEVFVLNALDSVVYQGRINDRYFAPGKRKPKTKRRDLDAVLRDSFSIVVVESNLTGWEVEWAFRLIALVAFAFADGLELHMYAVEGGSACQAELAMLVGAPLRLACARDQNCAHTHTRATSTHDANTYARDARN